MNLILKQALKYVNEFKWSVIPVRADGSKAPALPSWKEYRTRYATQEELQNWFKNQNNWLGIVTGQLSNLSVLDVDTKAPLTQLSVPTTAIGAATPNGRHLLFKYNESLKNWVKPTNQAWDIRTEGGYVVCSPSPGYRWLNPYFTRDTVARLPKFPLHLLPAEKVEIQRNPSGWIAEVLKNLDKGHRHEKFLKVIGRLHRDSFTPADILEILSPHAVRAEFPIPELEGLVKRVKNFEPPAAQEETNDDVSSFLQDITPVEWIVPGVIARASIGFVAGLPETYKTWLLLDLAIEAAKGGGKWLGKFEVRPCRVLFVDQERYKAETQRRFNSLLNAKGVNPKSLADSLYVRCGTTTRLDLDESFKAFRTRLQDIKPDLVIVDSFATFHIGGENDRQEIQKVIERVKELRKEFNCALLFIDHEGKSVYSEDAKKEAPNAFRMVGSVGKTAAAEYVFTVRKYDPQTCMVFNTKNSLAPCIESFPLSVTDVPNGVVVSSHE